MKAKVIIEKGKDNFYSCYMEMDDLGFGLNGSGYSVAEAKDDFMYAYDDALEMFPEKAKALEFEFVYDVPSFLQSMVSKISLAGLQTITGVNQKQLGHYMSGYCTPSTTTIAKIEKGVKKFAEELSHINFS